MLHVRQALVSSLKTPDRAAAAALAGAEQGAQEPECAEVALIKRHCHTDLAPPILDLVAELDRRQRRPMRADDWRANDRADDVAGSPVIGGVETEVVLCDGHVQGLRRGEYVSDDPRADLWDPGHL
eukprot:CAMPEP_0181188206 /NCGR_PEP_ID=MMETSP1096-20121128/10986_1 /TAXON_ID=156174 ORGANISM="Chrysochromulina ericina, Strain CCMP281" /NCGR_SAMPLE_ID=MMETSP1096 /ASSEMBLY_ACC=CAM_ASM_000453 /LENGTH=125 /DNA_ID=CAMNT_0023277239 /DNA_START=222 /DNA_END=600 /DNA_ORIENTATION=+